MDEYKLQGEELLASFRPDLPQNKQIQQQNTISPIQPNYSSQNQPQQSHPQSLGPSSLQNQNTQNYPYAHLGPHRLSEHISQGQLVRNHNPQIIISYNDMQRGIPPQPVAISPQIIRPPANQQLAIQYESRQPHENVQGTVNQ